MAAKRKTPSPNAHRRVPVPREPGAEDAVDLLMADHLHVSRLFAAFTKLKDSDQDEEKARLVREICEELSVHTVVEEELFYPAVRTAIEDDDLMDEALVEQAGAKDLIAQLREADPEDDLYDAKVIVLGEQIDHHVQQEERDMFLQARASDVDLVDLAGRLRERKAQLASGASPKSAAAQVPTPKRGKVPRPAPKRAPPRKKR